MSLDLRFEEPVPLPGGKQARTLGEAAGYVLKLRAAEKAHERWQNAADALRLVAEHKGPRCSRAWR